MRKLLIVFSTVLFSCFVVTLRAQIDKIHYLPPVYNENATIDFSEIVLTTNETIPFDVTISNADMSYQFVATGLSKTNPLTVKFPSGVDYDGLILGFEDKTNQVLRNEGLILTGDKNFFVNVMHKVTYHACIITSKGAIAGLGTEFYSGHLHAAEGGGNRAHFISVMASEDGTEVTIENPRVTFEGQPEQFTFTLDAGESYVVAAPWNYIDDLTADDKYNAYNGTHITSTKPIAVNTGSFAAGYRDNGQDAGVDQIVPVEYAGNEFIVIEGNGVQGQGASFVNAANEVAIVVATEDNTDIFVNGSTTPLFTINKGEYKVLEYDNYIDETMYIQTSQPSFVYQSLCGSATTPTPGMVFVPRLTDNAAKSVSISGVNDLGSVSLYITTKKGAELRINGILVDVPAQAVVGNDEWVAYRLNSDDINLDYCISGNDCATVGSVSTFSIESTEAMNAAVSTESGYVGAGGYYSGFGTPNAKAGVNKLGVSEYTLACDKPVNLLATGAISYTWSSPSNNMDLITRVEDSLYVFTPNSTAGPGPFLYTVDMEVQTFFGIELQTVQLTVHVISKTTEFDTLQVCLGEAIGLNGSPTEISVKTFAIKAYNFGGYSGKDANAYTYEGGGKYNYSGQTNTIANTEEDWIFQSEMWYTADMNFAYSLPNGIYHVKLMFAETAYSKIGERQFHVDIEGDRVETNLDLIAEVGRNTAYFVDRDVEVTDGILSIDILKGASNNPMVNGLLITQEKENIPLGGIYNWTPGDDLNYANVESPLFSPNTIGYHDFIYTYNDGFCLHSAPLVVNVEDCSMPCNVTASIDGSTSATVYKGVAVALDALGEGTFLEWVKLDGSKEVQLTHTTVDTSIRANEDAIYRVKYIQASNMVENGYFNEGSHVGFTVDPSYVEIPATGVGAPNQWSVGNGVEWTGSAFMNPSLPNPLPNGVGGNILYMDGGSIPNIPIYKTEVPVVAGNEYVFSAYVANIFQDQFPCAGAVPPELRFQIDGEPLDYITGLNIHEQRWVKFYTTWTATTTETITIELLNNSTAGCGNDFAIDNIVFSKVCSSDVALTVLAMPLEIEARPDTSLCASDYVNLYANVIAGDGSFLEWLTVSPSGEETLLTNTAEDTLVELTGKTTFRAKYRNDNPVLYEDFSGGEADVANFSSDYNFVSTGGAFQQSDFYNSGQYVIVQNANAIDWASDVADHSGTNSMMFVNGDETMNLSVYEVSNISVIAGKQYIFSIWVTSPVNDALPRAQLQFYVNGTGLGEIDMSTVADQQWHNFSTRWTANITGEVSLSIKNIQTAADGNDFAIDDIVFAEVETDDVTLYMYPKPSVDIGADRMMCEGENIDIENISQVDDYTWYRNGVVISSTFYAHADVAGNYKLLAESQYGCKDSSDIDVTLSPLPGVNVPDVRVCREATLQLEAGPNANYTYQWLNDDAYNTPIPGATQSYYNPPTNGIYYLQVTDISTGMNCKNVDTALADYLISPYVEFLYNESICTNGSPITITLQNTNSTGGHSEANTYTGLSNLGNDKYQFTQKDLSLGEHVLHFTWIGDNSCIQEEAISIAIHDAPELIAASNAPLCEGDALLLSTNFIEKVIYYWTGPDDFESVEVNPVVAKEAGIVNGGEYIVSGRNFEGCTNADTITVTIDRPITVFLGNDTALCAGESLNLDAGAADTYTWNTSETIENINVTSEGIYSVTVTSGTCSDVDSIEIVVNDLPQIDLGDDFAVCGDTLLNAGGTFNSYLWNTLATTPGISITQTGAYSVTVSDGNCENADTVDVVVNDIFGIPAITIGASSTTICPGETVDFSIVSQENQGSNATYQWFVNDVPVSTHTTYSSNTIANGDEVKLRLTISEICMTISSASDSVTIIVLDAIDPSVHIAPDEDSICEGLPITFYADQLSGGGTNPTYSWKINDVEVAVAPTFSTDTLTNGAVVSLDIVSNANCVTNATATANYTMTLIPLLTPELSIQANKDTVCDGEQVSVSILDTLHGGASPTFEWMANWVVFGTSVTSDLSPALSGPSSDIVATMTSSLACVTNATAADTITIIVIEAINPSIAIAAPNLCEKTDITAYLADSSGGGANPEFIWSVNNKVVGNTADDLQTDTLSAGAVIMLSMKSSVECPFKPIVYDSLVVQALPHMQFTYTANICLHNSPMEITVENSTGSGGVETFDLYPGLQKQGSKLLFNPTTATTGEHVLHFQWIDSNACSTVDSITVTVRDIEPPVVETSWSDIVGTTPYHTFEAEGSGQIVWYNSDKDMLITNPDLTPNETCTAGECIYTYYVNQVLQPWGCVSDTVEVTYILTSCPVSVPLVADMRICDYDAFPSFHADTAVVWNDVPIQGQSTLYWYQSKNDDKKTAYIHSGLTDYLPVETGAESYTFWVREYSSQLDCYSPPVSIALEITSVPAPLIANPQQVFCEGLVNIQKITAYGENIQWFSINDTTTTVIHYGNSYLPIDPAEPFTSFYARQIVASCGSPTSSAHITILPKPEKPIIQSHIVCENDEPFVFTVQNLNGMDVEWFNASNESISRTDRAAFSIPLSEIEIDSTLSFGAILYSNDNCAGDIEHATYTVLSIPAKPMVDGRDVVCRQSNIQLEVLAAQTPVDRVQWRYNNRLIHTGQYLNIDTALSLNNYSFSVSAFNKQCESEPVIVPVRIQDLPEPHILGESKYCVNTIQQIFTLSNVDTIEYAYNWQVSGNRTTYNLTEGESSIYVLVDLIEQGIDTIHVNQVDKWGCRGSDSKIVYVAEKPVADFDFTVYNEVFNVVFDNYSSQEAISDYNMQVQPEMNFSWHFTYPYDSIIFQADEEIDKSIVYSFPYGYYDVKLVAENDFHCKDSISKKVFMDQFISLYIPNAFAPTNYAVYVREFLPKGMGIQKYKIQIFDKWGNLIWISDKLTKEGSPAEGWDGLYDGILMQAGSYIWEIDATFINGTTWKGIEQKNGKFKKFGNVVLIR